MFNAEKCDFCGKCLEFCPYIKYDHDRAVAEIKDLVAGGNPSDSEFMRDMRGLQPGLSNRREPF